MIDGLYLIRFVLPIHGVRRHAAGNENSGVRIQVTAASLKRELSNTHQKDFQAYFNENLY